jgi:hypothetical protein
VINCKGFRRNIRALIGTVTLHFAASGSVVV